MALDDCPGLIALHPANDGLVARIRLPGGYASRPRWQALATLARQFGDGCLDLTARGNVQLRGVRAADAAALAQQAAARGLLPSAAHDRARNITASPLAGLGGRPPLRRLVTALDTALLADPELAALPGRFLFALDDGTGGAGLAVSDIGLRAIPPPGALPPPPPAGAHPARDPAATGVVQPRLRVLRVLCDLPWAPPGPGDDPVGYLPLAGPDAPAFDLLIAGRETGVRVPAAAAVPTALAAARGALERGVGAAVARIAALPDGGASLAAALGGTLGVPAPADTRLPLGMAVPGRVRVRPATTQRPWNFGALVTAAPLGRLTASQVSTLMAHTRAREVVRVGIAGRLVIPLRDTGRATHALMEFLGLPDTAADPRAGVTACSGAACRRSLADVRAAAHPVTHHPRTHWAGCARACGCPPDAQPVVALDATRYRLGDSEVS